MLFCRLKCWLTKSLVKDIGIECENSFSTEIHHARFARIRNYFSFKLFLTRTSQLSLLNRFVPWVFLSTKWHWFMAFCKTITTYGTKRTVCQVTKLQPKSCVFFCDVLKGVNENFERFTISFLEKVFQFFSGSLWIDWLLWWFVGKSAKLLTAKAVRGSLRLNHRVNFQLFFDWLCLYQTQPLHSARLRTVFLLNMFRPKVAVFFLVESTQVETSQNWLSGIINCIDFWQFVFHLALQRWVQFCEKHWSGSFLETGVNQLCVQTQKPGSSFAERGLCSTALRNWNDLRKWKGTNLSFANKNTTWEGDWVTVWSPSLCKLPDRCPPPLADRELCGQNEWLRQFDFWNVDERKYPLSFAWVVCVLQSL